MTNEALKRAKELEKKIQYEKEKIQNWEKSTHFQDLIGNFEENGIFYRKELSFQQVPFEVVKSTALAGHNKVLKEMENEFRNL